MKTQLILFALALPLAVACGGSNKPADDASSADAGDKASEAAKDAEDSAEKATEAAGDKAEDAGDKVEDATKDEE